MLFVSTFWLALFVDLEVATTNEQVSLWVHVPSVVEAGEEFELSIHAWDYCERLAGAYAGTVEVSLESYALAPAGILPTSPGVFALVDAPPSLTFTSNFRWRGVKPAYQVPGADNGRKLLRARLDTPGIHYFRVTEQGSGETFRSNPVVVHAAGTTFDRLYWGDIHTHSMYSDGSGLPAEVYAFGRDVARLDFAALTDHALMLPQFHTTPLFGRFQHYVATTNAFNAPGSFVTLVALEWTPMVAQQRSYLNPQHTNFYFAGESMPYFSTFTHFTPAEAYEYVARHADGDFLAWTHHTTRADYGADYAFYNESINRMFEVYSAHGACEFLNDSLNLYPETNGFPEGTRGYSANDALRMGCKFGFLAASDTHDGRAGHSITHTAAKGVITQAPYSLAWYRFGRNPGGLTALWARNLTRATVFEGLRRRAGYGTYWVTRPYLNFSINGVPVGQQDSTVLVASPTTPREIRLLVAVDGLAVTPDVTTTIERVEIFKNSALWYSVSVNEPLARLTFTDTAPVTGTSYDHCIRKADGRYYIHDRSMKPVDPATLNTGGADYYYARVLDSNGAASWIGPLWVNVTGAGST